jgi:hypothetical protein
VTAGGPRWQRRRAVVGIGRRIPHRKESDTTLRYKSIISLIHHTCLRMFAFSQRLHGPISASLDAPRTCTFLPKRRILGPLEGLDADHSTASSKQRVTRGTSRRSGHDPFHEKQIRPKCTCVCLRTCKTYSRIFGKDGYHIKAYIKAVK